MIQSPIYIDTFNALGANAVPMPFPEVYTALEQKTIDGQENPFTVIEANKFQEVQKYLAGTRHIYNPQTMAISKKTWDRLNKDEQDILISAASETQAYQRKVSRDAQDVALANLKKNMGTRSCLRPRLRRFAPSSSPSSTSTAPMSGRISRSRCTPRSTKVRGK